MPRKRDKRKSVANNEASEDEIVIDEDEQYQWLTDQIEAEATSKSRAKSKYGMADFCVVGLERIVSDVNDDTFDDLPITAVEAKIKLAKMYYERFHTNLVSSSEKSTAGTVMAATKRMDSIDRMYNRLNGILYDRLQQLQAEEGGRAIANSSVNAAAGHANDGNSRRVHIKSVDIEPFSGADVRKWPQFKSLFTECFHSRDEYTNAEKFYHLIAHLEVDSEAYKTIAGINRCEANYTSAWQLLCSAYDNERKIVNDIVLSFLDMDPVKHPNRTALIELVNNTNHLLQSLPQHKVDTKHWGPILVPLLVRKLDSNSAAEWAKTRNQKEIASIKPLLTFIRDRADSMDSEGTSASGASSTNNSSNGNVGIVSDNGHFRGPRFNQYRSTDSSGGYKHDPRSIKRIRKCYHCEGNHQLYDCIQFKRKTPIEREERLEQLGICVKCLRRGCSKAVCKMRNCNCGGEHNGKLLCPKNATANLLSVIKLPDSNTDIGASLIATLQVFACDSSGNAIKVRAMSDGGSHMTMISTRLMQQLKLKPTKLSIPLQGAGQFDIPSKAFVDLRIVPADNGSSDGEWVRAGILNTISNKLPLEEFDYSNWKHIHGLPLADTKFNVPDDVDILLSVEFMARIELEGFRKDVDNIDRPIARNTTFGWVVYGGLPNEYENKNMLVSHITISENQKIADNLERLWKVDEMIERTAMTTEEELCKKMFDETVTRSPDGRYIVTMPIKKDAPKLGNSLRAAMARQFTNERRFKNDPDLKQKYVNDIQQFIDLDHMELVPHNEIHKDDSSVYYMPHHAANSDKFRVVFDGSVKTSTGVALNDILMNGPRLQDDLVNIVMRFRKFKVALTTDIKKMYRQVMVPKYQRDLLRIVWRKDEKELMKHYRMKRQTYGLKSSAFCCVAALCQCALDYAEEFPLASKAVLEAFYVDDGTPGADDDVDAEELYRQLNVMLSKGGFPLAKWATNSTHMQSVIGATAKTVDFELFNESSVLGIKWSVTDDRFKYGLSAGIPNQPPTKRFIVASVARLFDPNGWIAPIVVFGKILIQEVWRAGCDWDTIVPSHIQTKWDEFKNSLLKLSKISIPRWLGMGPGKSVQIHGFADASSKAYGICFYARVESENGIECNLVIAKTKVAPLKGMTIPRLELCAVAMLAKACKHVCDTHGVSMENVTLWTDSSIVIHWLSKDPKSMKEFVRARVMDVQEKTKDVQWKHVRTDDNPADLASRGVLTHELVGNSLWFKGPSWLCEKKENWPVSQFEVNHLIEKATAGESVPRKVMAVIRKDIVPRIDSPQNQSRDELLIDHCSSMMKLVRVTARVLRVVESMKRLIKKDGKQYESMAIRHSEYLEAQSIWIVYHQQKWFPNELAALNALKNGGKSASGIAKESPLLKMTPFIDGNGIMRVGGRIKRSLMPFDTKHPIIIHGGSRFARLLALEAHSCTLHGGTQQCMQYIRQRFWVTNLRMEVKKVALKCISCFRQRKEVAEQLMGDLPHARVVAGHAFQSVGVDYFGPIEVKENVGRNRKTFKAHVALFVCMKSKGIYLDLVTNLTSDSFLACLSRLTSARGRPSEIFSDNATTFHGADNEIRAIHAHWSKLANCPELDPIKWTFITPLSPSQGGLWERAVRSAKHHLRRVIGTQILTYEEYDTLLKNVASCLNSRPLIALDDDPSSAQALTPAHLFMGRAIVGPLQYNYMEVPDNRLERWRFIQKLYQQFWAQWQCDVVANQIERNKWRIERNNVQVGAVVLLKIDNMPPTHWPLGRVVAVFPGDDGRVRNVEVTIGNSTYRRSVNKIAVLPIEDDEEKGSQ